MGRLPRLEKIAFLPFRFAIVIAGIVMISYLLLFLFLKSPQGVEFVSKKIREVVNKTTGLNIKLESIRLDIFTAELRLSQFGLKNDIGEDVIFVRGLNVSLSIPYLLLGKIVISEVSVDGVESKIYFKDKKILGFEGLFKQHPESKDMKEDSKGLPDITVERFLVSNLNVEFRYEDILTAKVELQELSGSYVAKSAEAKINNLQSKLKIKNDIYHLKVNSGLSYLGDTLAIKYLSVVLDSKEILLVSGDLKNLLEPELDLNTFINIPLRYLENYPINMKSAEGEISLSCVLRGKITLPIAECRIDGNDIGLEQFRIGNFKGEVVYDNGDIQIRNFRIDNYGNKVTINASGEIKEQVKFIGNVNIEKLELAELLRNLGVNSIVMLDIKGSVEFKFYIDPEKGVIVDTKPALSIVGPKIFSDYYFSPKRGEPIFFLKGANLSGDVVITEKGVSLKSVDINTEKSSVKVRNSFIGFLGDGYMDLKAISDNLDFSDITPIAGLDIRGISQLSTLIRGPLPSLRIQGDVSARGFMFENFYGGTVKVQVEFFNNLLSFKNIAGRVNEMSYSGDVVLNMMGKPDIEAIAEIRDAQVKNVISLLPQSMRIMDIKRGIFSIKTNLRGPITNLNGSVEAIISDLLINGEKIDKIDWLLRLEDGNLDISNLSIEAYGGKIEANGKIGKEKDIAFEVSIKGIKIGDSQFIKSLPVKVSGIFEGRLNGGGSLDTPNFSFLGEVKDVKVLSNNLGTLNIDGFLKGRLFGISASLQDQRILFSMKNSENNWERYNIRANLRELDVLRFFTENIDISTTENIDVDLTGDLKKGDIGGTITIKAMSANAYDMKFSLKNPVVLTLSESGIDFSDINVIGEDIEVIINASQFNPKSLNINGRSFIPLRILKGLTKNTVNATGVFSADFSVHGSIDNPDINVNGSLENSLIKLSFFPHPFENTLLKFFVQRDLIVINELKGRLAGGSFNGSGEIRLESFVPRYFDVRLDINRAFLSFPKELPSVINGYITIGGDLKRLLIGGEIDIERALYSKNIDFNMLLVELTRKRPKYTTYSKENEFVFFDIGLKASSGILVKNNLVSDSEFKADLRLTGSNERIGLVGTVNAMRGKMVLSGNEYTLKRGIVQFTERYRIAYNLDFVLSTVCRDTNSGLEHNIDMSITGSDESIRINYKDNTSPPFSETDIITCLALGATPQKVGSQEKGQEESFGILSSVVGVDQKLKDIIPIPVETFRISSKYSESLRMNVPQVQVTWKLMENLRLNYSSSLVYSQDQKIELDYRLNRKTSLRTQWNSQAQVPVGNLGVDVKWSWEF